jgi:predicted XRE-type DNA-binding protein
MIGSSFDDFLKEENIYEECTNIAIKSILVEEIEKYLYKNKITKTEFAKRLNTSRMEVNRILDKNNNSITLKTLEKISYIIGKQLKVEFI